jgi:RNA polymerase sigma-70 factor (ECF subfamily)
VEESSILKLIQEGDTDTFEMIFNKYYKPLVAYSNTILKSHDEAEDIVQQVFITVWNKKQDIGSVQSLKSYLYRSVYNSSLNRIKQLNVRQEYAKDYVLTHSEGVGTADRHKELQQRIETALEQLPEQCGKIFRMSRFEQLKYQEIADQMGLSVKTVENQMGKALKLMREKLKDYLPLFILFIAQYFDN